MLACTGIALLGRLFQKLETGTKLVYGNLVEIPAFNKTFSSYFRWTGSLTQDWRTKFARDSSFLE